MMREHLAIGDIIAGKYYVERVISQGAMGVVVAVQHRELGRLCAIKLVLSEEIIRHVPTKERVLRRARTLARLRSEYLPRVYYAGETESGKPYIVQELFEGEDLGAVLKSGVLTTEDACLYMFQACAAIDEAHAQGIIHLDLKLANLFLTRRTDNSPCIKVLGFDDGPVALHRSPAESRDLSSTNSLMGSPLYMSPELFRSSPEVDSRADIWALGVILYRLLTNKAPFPGSTIVDVFEAATKAPPTPIASVRSDIPAQLEAVILRCLEKDPGRRYQSVRELMDHLRPFVDNPPAMRTSVVAMGPEPGLQGRMALSSAHSLAEIPQVLALHSNTQSDTGLDRRIPADPIRLREASSSASPRARELFRRAKRARAMTEGEKARSAEMFVRITAHRGSTPQLSNARKELPIELAVLALMVLCSIACVAMLLFIEFPKLLSNSHDVGAVARWKIAFVFLLVTVGVEVVLIKRLRRDAKPSGSTPQPSGLKGNPREVRVSPKNREQFGFPMTSEDIPPIERELCVIDEMIRSHQLELARTCCMELLERVRGTTDEEKVRSRLESLDRG